METLIEQQTKPRKPKTKPAPRREKETIIVPADLSAIEKQLQTELDAIDGKIKTADDKAAEIIAKARQEADAATADLRGERDRLTAALAGLRGQTTVRRSSGGGTRRRRESVGDISGQVMEFVQANPGTGTSAIAESLGAPAASVRNTLNEMISTGSVRKEGEKRGTKYYLA